MASKRVHLLIAGRVQGVCYRAYTSEQAQDLGVMGWVRNLPDGRVEVTAEGPEDRLKQLVTWCWSGPPWAKVQAIEEDWQEPTDEFQTFRVRY
jgi:acylphosphatase